jgi:uncharacterized protein (TIGR00255 family)
MIKSMTGFGQAENEAAQEFRLRVEVRSVNHRYLDLSIRTPRDIQPLEEKVRRGIQQAVSRGRIDCTVTLREGSTPNVHVMIDKTLVDAYYHALTQVGALCALEEKPDLSLITRFPDCIRVEKDQVNLEIILQQLEPTLKLALSGLVEQREAEGARLAEDITGRLSTVRNLVTGVEQRTPAVTDEYRRKLQERITSYLDDVEVDPARLLTEVAIFADRSNVTEELVRLKSHLTAFHQALQEDSPVGRKLDFLTQELFREVNTIGSKANDYEIARLTVDMKTELEKIREQVQNIE